MSEKDTTAKAYMSDNERFADLFNYKVFGGKKVIDANCLVEKDSTEVISFLDVEETDKSIKLQKWRDLLKGVEIKSDERAIYAILGIENQSDIHYAMAVRSLLYDAISYAKQVDDVAKRHRKDRDVSTSAEFLSGFTKDDKLKPVVTLTIYWGADKWDAPRTLYDMLNTDDEDILRYVSDYSLNLVIPEEITDFSSFRTELGKLFNVFKVSKNEDDMRDLFKRDAYSSIKIETVDMLNTFLGVKIPKTELNEKGEINMCKAWEDHYNSGLAKGAAGERLKTIQKLITKGCDKDFIFSLDYTEEEYTKAEKELMALV